MVRLEKTLYEKLFNNKYLGRARAIKTPAKFHYIDREVYLGAASYYQYKYSYYYRYIMRPIIEFCYQKYGWNFARDLQLQRGYLPDDIYVHDEVDLRRNPFAETVWRQSTHPYQWIFYTMRRYRFFKVDRITQGFFVPDYVRDDVKNRTLFEAFNTEWQWNKFVYNNYYSDLSPGTYWMRSKINPIEMLNFYGFWRLDAWQRYFLNEEKYDWPDEENLKEVYARPLNCDIATEEGRAEFERKLNGMIENYPGMVVPEGEKFNFRGFYARFAINHNLDKSDFNQEELDAAQKVIEEGIVTNAAIGMEGMDGEGDGKVEKNTVGKVFPRKLSKNERKAFMN